MRSKLMTGVALAVALALCGGSAFAVDQLLKGKKLLITNPASGTTNNKLLYLSKDPTIVTPHLSVAQDPRCAPAGSGAGAVLLVTSPDSGETFSISLPCANWSRGGTAYKYQDLSGNTCKIVMVKAGTLVKAVCKGSQVAYDLGAAQATIRVQLSTGTAPVRYCTDFSSPTCDVVKDGSDDKKYLAKNCSSGPGSCVGSASGAFIEAASLF